MPEDGLFRKKSIERLSTPEDLSDYLRVTNPGIWMVLACIIGFILGVLVWGAMAHLETTLPVSIEVVDNEATVIVTGADVDKIKEGMPLKTDNAEGRIEKADLDEYGRMVVKASLFTDDGKYDGDIVTERVTPISFLMQ